MNYWGKKQYPLLWECFAERQGTDTDAYLQKKMNSGQGRMPTFLKERKKAKAFILNIINFNSSNEY